MDWRQLREDAKNLGIIGASAGAAVLVTGVLVARAMWDSTEDAIREAVLPLTVVVSTASATPSAEALEPVPVTWEDGPAVGDPLLYGTVRTRDGRELTGFLRWDRNEGAWADVLDADKLRARGGATRAGIRFARLHALDVVGSSRAVATLKSGERIALGGRATDLGSGLRALTVTGDDGSVTELKWRQLDRVEFQPAPADARAPYRRLWGTLTTRSGEAFTGFVTWDIDEIFTSDVLDGSAHRDDYRIPFERIRSITPDGRRAARVVLTSGEELRLRGTNDVDASNSGITVSDPALGQVAVAWEELASVTFQDAPEETPGYGFVGADAPLEGTVLTDDGRELSGRIAWDRDESSTWEMLDGDAGGVSFQVEMGAVARIERTDDGARVTLRDGRTLELSDSNDVDDGNRGIRVDTDDGSTVVPWSRFRELRLR